MIRFCQLNEQTFAEFFATSNLYYLKMLCIYPRSNCFLPAAPWAWIHLSMTVETVLGAATFIIAISFFASCKKNILKLKTAATQLQNKSQSVLKRNL